MLRLRFILILALLFAFTGAARATDITLGSIQSSAMYRGTETSLTLRIYASDTFTDSNGKVIAGAVAGSSGFYLQTPCTNASGVITCSSVILPSTTDSSRINASYTGILYANGSQKMTLFSGWRMPVSLGTSISFSQFETYNRAPQKPLGDAFYTKDQVNALIASAISGSGAPKMNDVTYGKGRLYESAVDANAPILPGINSLFINSARTQNVAALTATSKEGTSTKLLDSFRGWMYDNGYGFTRGDLGVIQAQYFGAKDDNSTDSRAAIQAAINRASTEGSGVVRLSYSNTGTYRLSAPLVIPSKVILEGEISATGAKTRLYLTSSSSNIITIGENTDTVTVRNLELVGSSLTTTTGILLTGSGANASQGFHFENISCDHLDKCLSVEAQDGPRAWQASYITANNIVGHGTKYGIYIDSVNSDWLIDNLTTYTLQDGYGVYCANCSTIQINHSNLLGANAGSACAVGVPNVLFGEDAIHIEGQHGAITVINSQQEGFRNTLVNNSQDLTYPITFINTVMGAPVKLNQSTNFVSIGNYYYDNTVQAAGDTRIYSMGDSIDSRNVCLDAGSGVGGFSLSGGAYIVNRNSIYGTDYQLPVAFGSKAPDTTDPALASTPIVRIGSPTSLKALLTMGQTDSGRAFVNRYDFLRDGNGLLYIRCSQAIPNCGVSVKGVFEFAGTNAATAAPASTARFNYNANADLLQFSVNTRAYANIIGATTTPTVNRLLKVITTTTNPIVGDSLFFENGTNGGLASGGFLFGGTSTSEVGLFRSTTTLKLRLADNSADADFTAKAGTFSGAVIGTIGTFSGAVKSTAGVSSFFKGGNVASATAIVPTGNLFHVTGTTSITSVDATGLQAGTRITIIFDGVCTFTDGSNLKLAGNFVTTADDTITLVWDGSNWYEASRSVN